MSNSSGLSAPPSSEDEKPKPKSKGKEKATLKLVNGKLGGFKKKKASPPPSSPEPDQVDLGREASPPHEYVLADNRDIAVSARGVWRVLLTRFECFSRVAHADVYSTRSLLCTNIYNT